MNRPNETNPGGPTGATEADLLFVNGVIYTVDRDDRLAESLAVRDGRIIFVGDEKGAMPFKGPRTEVVDLRGGLLLPGFADAHIHAPGPLTAKLFDFDLSGLFEADRVMGVIEAAVKGDPGREMYLGWGYPTSAFTGAEGSKGPRKERLDAVSADKPIIVVANDCHSVWMNSRALEVFGITSETPPPAGGVIEKDDRTGELWGVLKDAAMALVKDVRAPREKMLEVLEEFQGLMHRLGYTSITAMAATFIPVIGDIPWEFFREMEREGRLTLKIDGSHCLLATDELEEKIKEAEKLREEHGGEFLRLNTIKIFADGVVDLRTAFLLEPYTDAPVNLGEPGWEREQLYEALARANEAGFQVHTHAIGDAAVRLALDACEYAGRLSRGRRNVITHLQLGNPLDLPRLKSLSVVACVQPYWHIKQPEYWEPVEQRALGERAERMYPLKSLFEAGAVVVSSSDSPITMRPDPLMAIQSGVTRNLVVGAEYNVPDIADPDDPAWLLGADQRVSVGEMIRSFTVNSAYAAFRDKDAGCLEPGKQADLVVLDKNILVCPQLEIHQARVRQTYVNGRLVYSAE